MSETTLIRGDLQAFVLEIFSRLQSYVKKMLPTNETDKIFLIGVKASSIFYSKFGTLDDYDGDTLVAFVILQCAVHLHTMNTLDAQTFLEQLFNDYDLTDEGVDMVLTIINKLTEKEKEKDKDEEDDLGNDVDVIIEIIKKAIAETH